MTKEYLYDVDVSVDKQRVRVVPLEVLDRGVQEGCRLETVLLKFEDGPARTSESHYFKTEAAAWVEARDILQDTINDLYGSIQRMQEKVAKAEALLDTIADDCKGDK